MRCTLTYWSWTIRAGDERTRVRAYVANGAFTWQPRQLCLPNAAELWHYKRDYCAYRALTEDSVP